MNQYHQEILDQIKKAENKNKSSQDSSNYSGTTHYSYGLTIPELRKIIKNWSKENKNISFNEFVELLNSLFDGNSKQEKKAPGHLFGIFTLYRSKINSELLNKWTSKLQGWEEVDSLCQSVFNANNLLENWSEWEKTIIKLSNSPKLEQKRASLVLLTGPVRQSNDKKLSNLAFQNIDILKKEKDILITKAISWLLRELVKHHKQEVEYYLNKNLKLLPKIP